MGEIIMLNDTSCLVFEGEEYKCNVVLTVRKIMTSLSWFACIFIIGMIVLFRMYKVFIQRLILYLTISDTIITLSHSMSKDMPEEEECHAEAFMLHFGMWAVLLWVICITHNMYKCVITEHHMFNYERGYSVFAWGGAALISSIPFIVGRYGPAGLWCWIVSQAEFGDWSKWQFAMWYIPCFTLIICLVVGNVYIWVKLEQKLKAWQGPFNLDNERKKLLMKEDVKPLKWFPIIYLIVTIPPLIHRVAYAVHPQWNFSLMLFHTIFSPLQGFLNGIVFAFDKDVTYRLNVFHVKLAVLRCVGWKKKERLLQEYPIIPVLHDEEHHSLEFISHEYSHGEYNRHRYTDEQYEPDSPFHYMYM